MKLVLDHTPNSKNLFFEPKVKSLATNIVLRTNCRFVKPQNGPTLHAHASQSSHVVIGEIQPPLIHLPTPIGRNYFPI
jgi:hypothetical protein